MGIFDKIFGEKDEEKEWRIREDLDAITEPTNKEVAIACSALKKIYPKSFQIDYTSVNDMEGFYIMFYPEENDDIFKIVASMYKENPAHIHSEWLYKKSTNLDMIKYYPDPEWVYCLRSYHPNNILYHEQFFNWKFKNHGKSSRYDENGKLVIQKTYNNGRAVN